MSIEKELLHAKEFLSLSSDLLVVARPDGTIELANPSAGEFVGLAPHELEDRSFLDLVHPDERDKAREALESNGPRATLVCLCQGGDGAYRSVEWAVQAHPDNGLVYLIGTDVTDRTHVEEELRDSEERGRALFDNAAQAIISVDARGRIRTMNPMAEKLFGYEAQEISGRDLDVLMPDAMRAAHRRHVEGFFEEPRTRPMGIGLDLVGCRKDGSEFPVEISLSHIETKEGSIAVAFVNDITERQKALSEHQKLEHRLEHATKMEAVGRLAGGIAHDFNNLLTALTGFSEIVLDELPEDHLLYEGARETYKTCQRSASLVRRLLAVSRRQMLQPQVLDVNAKLAELEKMLVSVLGEDIEFSFKPSASQGFIRADESQIEQVILNLVVNARDAMPEGGRLTIQTKLVDVDDAFVEHHVGIRPGPHILITVSDTGEGMGPETLEHIFEPFFTTKEKGKGTGLGLATVYGIVQQSDGNIWVYSEPGQGTVFKVYLPRVNRAGRAAGEENGAQQPMKGSETILVVEDENTVRLVTVSNLKKAGYDVLEARDGDDACRIAAEHGGPIDLVVTDVVMPRMNGPKMVKEVRKGRPNVKVLYMSGHADDALVHHGVIEEGLAFLEKPFTRVELTKQVREVLDGP